MTDLSYEEALTVLGLEASASSDAVRRAYLRLLKKHKPERDPEAFMRLRLAYELVSSEALCPSCHQDIADNDVQSDPSPSLTEPEGDSTLATFLASLYTLPEDAPAETRLAIARAAVAACPNDATALWLLVDHLDDLGEPDLQTERIATLRTGAALGHPGFFAALVEAAPLSLTNEERGQLLSAEDPNLHVLAAQSLLAAHRLDEAYDAVRAAVDVVETAPVEDLSIAGSIQDLGLLLMAQGLPREGAGLISRAHDWIARRGDELRLGAQNPRWVVTEELATVTPHLPPELASALAQWIDGDDSDQDCSAWLGEYARLHSEQFLRARTMTACLAPRLHQLLAEVARDTLGLVGRGSGDPYRSSGAERWFYLTGLFIIIAIVALSHC